LAGSYFFSSINARTVEPSMRRKQIKRRIETGHSRKSFRPSPKNITLILKGNSIMNTKIASALVIAASAFAAGSAMAQPVFADVAGASKNRAEVQTELATARAKGEVASLTNNRDELQAFFTTNNTSNVTRAQVRAELATARAKGEVASLTNNRDDLQMFFSTTNTADVTRAQVRAELANARAKGEVASLTNS
jgi:subtilisin family serine protease